MSGSVFVAFCCIICLIHQTQAMAFIQKTLTFENCGSNSIFDVQQLDVDPYPAQSGGTVSLKATVNSRKSVTGGKVKAIVMRGSFKLFEKEYDLCSVVPTTCPIRQGPTTISIRRKFPQIPITGTFDVKIVATSDQGEQLLCAKLPLEIA